MDVHERARQYRTFWSDLPAITVEEDKQRVTPRSEGGDAERYKIIERYILRVLRAHETCPGSLPVTAQIIRELDELENE